MQARSWSKTFGILLLVTARPATGDTVKLTNKPAFCNVSITDFRGGRLVFRGVSGEYLRKPLEEVEWLTIDGEPALNVAEQAATAGNWAEAGARYDEALATIDRPWLRNVVRLRLSTVCEHAGRFDRAVGVYVELLASSPALAAAHSPRSPGPVGSDMNGRARATLEQVLASKPAAAVAEPVRTLLLELLIYEDADPLPPSLIGAPATTAPATGPAPGRVRHLGILPGPDEESEPAASSQPAGRSRTAAVEPTRLTSDSLLLRVAQVACDAGDFQRAARLVQRGMTYVDTSDRGPWRLLQGRCQIEFGKAAEAASDLLNLSETDPDRGRAAWALYYVARAHERLERTDVARSLYEELLQRVDAPEDVRASARAALQRLNP